MRDPRWSKLPAIARTELDCSGVTPPSKDFRGAVKFMASFLSFLPPSLPAPAFLVNIDDSLATAAEAGMLAVFSVAAMMTYVTKRRQLTTD